MTDLPKPVLAQVRAILSKDVDADRMALFWPDPMLDLERESVDLDALLE
ncbi:MAG: hypothetical protein K9L70_04270 [Thiohalocapsa sp.]|nr:hypothetical protein [Thiohalocapsa sp.]MCF7991824.1 hypothetical protein [Thiohalocapsa sp.]